MKLYDCCMYFDEDLMLDLRLNILSENVDKLKSQMEQEIPMIQKNDMVIQFHEERIIDLEEKNGTY